MKIISPFLKMEEGTERYKSDIVKKKLKYQKSKLVELKDNLSILNKSKMDFELVSNFSPTGDRTRKY